MVPDAPLEVAYRLLSASLCHPSEGWREEDIFFHLGEALRAVSPETAGRAEIMKEAFLDPADGVLSAEYARLFVGPFALPAPPYGSVYMEPGGRVMGETTRAVSTFYREAGLSLEEDPAILPDHMAVELEFMSYLLQMAIRSVANGDAKGRSDWVEKRRSFLDTFLSRWYGEFCERIRRGTENRFYRSLADCLEAVVRKDMDILSVGGEKA